MPKYIDVIVRQFDDGEYSVYAEYETGLPAFGFRQIYSYWALQSKLNSFRNLGLLRLHKKLIQVNFQELNT